MPIEYRCDTCGITDASAVGWLIVSVQYMRHDPGLGLSGRALTWIAPDWFFHSEECRKVWSDRAGIPPPPANLAPLPLARVPPNA